MVGECQRSLSKKNTRKKYYCELREREIALGYSTCAYERERAKQVGGILENRALTINYRERLRLGDQHTI